MDAQSVKPSKSALLDGYLAFGADHRFLFRAVHGLAFLDRADLADGFSAGMVVFD